MPFDEAGSLSFGNNFVRNVLIYVLENSSSSHSDNRKSNFLIQIITVRIMF